MSGSQIMTDLFENQRNYVLSDTELELLGDREKLAQWRHMGHESEQITDTHYGKLSDNRRKDIFDEMGKTKDINGLSQPEKQQFKITLKRLLDFLE